ncbi:MAG: DUF1365 domain-containing protein [Rhodospirillaceae bacterium]|nr:DUF1365 domain-containing protein [Rhodospirillaceae bacterium]
MGKKLDKMLQKRKKNSSSNISLYFGSVTHIRRKPMIHKFIYRVFFIYANLQILESRAKSKSKSKSNFLWGHNKPALFSFYDKDHGLRDGTSTYKWFVNLLEKEGIQFDGKVYIACYPRVLGYVFNPISVYFYFNNSNCLEAIVYEVKNTFGDQHSYLIKTNTNSRVLTHSCKKKMIVSPFNSVDHIYEFKTIVPDNKFYLSIDELENKEKILSAYLEGKKKKFSNYNLLISLFLYPFMTFKVIIAIHYEAFRLFNKGVKVSPEVPKIKNKTVAFSIRLFLSIYRFLTNYNKKT